MSTVAAIKDYMARGWSIIPIQARDKRPCEAWEDFAICAADGPQWNNWWRQYRGCNIAVVYGGCQTPPGLQLICIDTDSAELEAWVASHTDLPPTPTVRTAKGFHRYFLAPAGLEHFQGTSERPEVRAGTHYTLLPPSIHPSGAQYEWLDGLSLADVDIAELPPWGVALMRQDEEQPKPAAPKTPEERATSYGKAALGREIGELAAMQQGGRNDGLNAAAYSLGQLVAGGVLDEVEVRQALIGACHANGLVKADGMRAVERTLQSGLTKGMAEPRSAPERAQTRRYEDTVAAPPAAYPEPPPLPEDDAAMPDVAAAVNGLTEPSVAPAPATPSALLRDIAGRVSESLEEYRARERVVRGFRSGFAALDNHYLGFSEQGMILLQGPSGYGKTTFARHCIFATALAAMQSGSDEHVMAFLLEDTERGLLSSYLGYRGVPEHLREPGSERYMTKEWEAVLAAGYAEFWGLPIVLEAKKRLDMRDIEQKVREEKQRLNIVGVVIDHAQHVQVRGVGNLHEKLNLVAERTDALATEIKTPIMVLSQTTVRDGDFKPQYSDQLRQLADLSEVVTRGTPGCSREEAIQSNIMRVLCDKSRWKSAHRPLILQGDQATGRLEEMDNHSAPEEPAEENPWPNN